jgi:aryl-alcohol dehydrogenase-like predicted oxidoreductase
MTGPASTSGGVPPDTSARAREGAPVSASQGPSAAAAAAAGDFPLGGDLRVNRLGFGAMRLVFGGRARDPEAGVAVLRRAVELGVNHIDTAGFYGFGDVWAHETIRRALSPYPDDLVIATKVGPLLEGGVLPTGQATPEQLRALVEEDLRRLGLDRLDLVYLRVAEPDGESVAARFEALAELRREGLIRHLGLSNVGASQLAEAQAIAPVAAVQNHFHVQYRGDSGLLAQCEQQGIAYVPYFPLGGGREPIQSARLTSAVARHQATVAQVALAWLLALSPVTLAIPGTSSLDHLTENVAAAGLRVALD